MTNEVIKARTKSSGDAAVDGLLAGLGAGLAMAVYLIVAGVLGGESPGLVLSRFAVGEIVSPLVGAISHLATSAIYGAVFGILVHVLPRRLPGWLSGLLYGVMLFMIAQFLILPGTDSPLREFSGAHFAVAHLVFGLGLGLLTHRKR